METNTVNCGEVEVCSAFIATMINTIWRTYMKIPFSPPDITQAEIDEVVDALESGWITTGPKVKQLEEQVAKRCGTSKAVCLNSNTACSEMTL